MNLDNNELAIFKDKNGTLYFSTIRKDLNEITIDTYTFDYIHISEVKLNEYRSHYYLYNLYTEKNYRNLGITSRVSELIDYIVSDSNMTCICGFFNPFDFSEDRKAGIYSKDITKIAETFYTKNGYEILTYNTFIKNREKYKELYSINFNKGKQKIIYKQIQKQELKYEQIRSIIVHKNALDEINKISSLLEVKTLKL